MPESIAERAVPVRLETVWQGYASRTLAKKPLFTVVAIVADHRSALPGFFDSLGVTFIAGRNFDISDEVSGRKVVIVDDTLAGRLWPGGAIGKKLNVENGRFVRAVVEVVGVVKHIQHHSLANQVRPQLYLPSPLAVRTNIAFTVRASIAPQTLAQAIRQEVAKLDKDLPVARIRPMDDYVSKALTTTQFVAMLSIVLAGTALLLACVGIYGVTSSSVSQRTSEIGIRMALGAQRSSVLGLILRQTLVPMIVGSLIGLALSLGLMPLLSSLLFGVRPIDPATVAAASILLCSMGLLASFLPTRRATHGDPLKALRYE